MKMLSLRQGHEHPAPPLAIRVAVAAVIIPADHANIDAKSSATLSTSLLTFAVFIASNYFSSCD